MHHSDATDQNGKPKWSAMGFWALIATQFQGAFNDNFFKQIIILFIVYGSLHSGETTPSKEVTDRASSVATLLFALPFILFPGLFGAFADKHSKKDVAVWTKYLEVFVMLLGTFAFLTGNYVFLWATLFMMATQSAIFGPAKYGLLPEILPEERLSWGNGIIQMSTMVAIIAGLAVGPGVFQWLRMADSLDRMYLSGFILVLLSGVGVVMSWGITRPPAADPKRRLPINPWHGMWRDIKIMYANPWLRMTILGYVYFWFLGSLLLTNLNSFGLVELGLDETHNSYLQAVLTLGIGLGSVGAGYFSRGKIELGLIPIGAFGMAVMCVLIYFFGHSFNLALAFLAGLGFFAGFFDVPLAATLQHRSPDEYRGSIMATSNMLTFVGIAAAAPVSLFLSSIGVSSHGVFAFTGFITLGVTGLLCVMLPIVTIRAVLWVLANTLYQLNVVERHHIPDKGGALFVANHTSFIDALVILASTDRHIRFVMSQDIFDIPWIKPIAKIMNAIPVSGAGSPTKIIQSLHAATAAIKNGEVVCIFAEGQITRTGQLLPFKKGFERIMRGVDAPIIPVHLDRLWGSIFSYADGSFFWKMPLRIPYEITISYGKPLPPTARAGDVRLAVQQLGSDAHTKLSPMRPLLHRAFVESARKHPFRHAMSDMRVAKLSYGKALIGSIAMAWKLKELLGSAPMVGILVPPSVGGALANIAVQFLGKTAVNLNYTASRDSILSAAKQCNLTHVITSKAFLEKLPVEVPGKPVYLEDVVATITGLTRVTSMVMALLPVRVIEVLVGSPMRLLPVRVIEILFVEFKRRSSEDLAAIIFSSGSAGDPKGVMLTHANISSNIEAVLQVFPHDKHDGMVGILPFFHSFGFMGTLWLPLIEGFRVAYHPNPLDAKAVGALIKKHQLTFLIATPTFLQTYIRRCLPEELTSLRWVVTGAEKLQSRVREAFKAKFGVEPLEGYGTTECAPAVSINVPHFEAPGFFQVGTKHGTIGHPLPSISVKIIDPESNAPVQDGNPGLLFVKGPNIMKGYLGMEEKTAEVLQDGWYNTGDIATIDEDGFITITDRLARFSKIAGEMVPHTKIEEVLHEQVSLTDQALAVVGVPDEKKGERLVVLHTLTDEQLERLMGKLDTCGLPNLWIPKSNCFYRIDAIPVLGTGKMDLQKVKQLGKKFDLGE